MANVVVTGGAGFIGKAVVKNLLSKKYSVTVIDNLSKGSNEKLSNVTFKKIDLLDSEKTAKAFAGADYCIHLAAKIGGIGYFHMYPADIISQNNNMMTSVFDAAYKNKLKRIVYISSSMVYESATTFPSAESDTETIPMPKTAYGFSKLIGERYAEAYFDQHHLSYSIVRPFNAYGPHEMPGEEVGIAHVIPDILKKIYTGQYPVEVLGDGKQVRCFTHVDDIAEGIVRAMSHPHAKNDIFNIADSRPVSVNQLVETLWKITGQTKKLKIRHSKGFQGDVAKRIPDTSKAQKILKFQPQISFEEGLSSIVDWYKSLYATK